MVARWGGERGLVFPMRKMNGKPGDHEGHPYGAPGLLPDLIA